MSTDTNNNLPIRMESIQPILAITDMSVSRSFYTDVLGFEEADWGNDDFTSMSRDNTGLYLSRGDQGNPGTWIWIGFSGDILAFYEYLKLKAVTILQPPVNYSWALEMHVEDPDGHVLRFGTDPNPNEPFFDSQA